VAAALIAAGFSTSPQGLRMRPWRRHWPSACAWRAASRRIDRTCAAAGQLFVKDW